MAPLCAGIAYPLRPGIIITVKSKLGNSCLRRPLLPQETQALDKLTFLKSKVSFRFGQLEGQT